ncbi:MAG TPA: DUF2071 domain-containing protein [Acidobacteriaceae bacterium]|nr:DUF2071 domain-containing protein [Acidobacteriaceae bacterium]
MPSTFLTAEWRKLIMAQYEVEPTTLAPWLPAGLELDLFHGRCYVSLVGFLFDRVRIKGIAIPFHTRFEEINLRLYVAHTEPDGTRKRGVVFIREFVSRPAITLVARSLYEEPYATVPTRHTYTESTAKLGVTYAWKHRSRWHSLAVEAAPTPQLIAPDSEEEFITEHYFGYTKRTRGATSEYAVQHPRWQTYPILSQEINADLGSLYGPAFASLNAQQPASVLLAEGSAVTVSSGRRLSS